MAQRRLASILLLLISFHTGPAAAELRAGLEPRVIDELGTTRLTIRAGGSNETQALDLSALEEDFDVLGTQSASQYRAVNGQVEAWVEYQISLRPRRAGTLTVPAVTVGADSTRPLELTVRPVDPEVRDAIDRMVFFETELSTNPVYVQAETVLTRRLYYSSGAQIYSDLPGVPDIENAVVTPLGETRSSTTLVDGQRYGVVEQRFAILPELSGILTIPSISVTSSVRIESNGRLRRSGVRVSTDALTLDVLPIPAEYPGDQPWLPAAGVTVTDTWDPDTGSIPVGEPINRVITVRVTGNVASVIPALQPELQDGALRQYPEPPDLTDDTSGATVIGSREQRYALVPTQPGTAQIAEVSVTWWDVANRTVRTTRAPERLLRVTGSPATAEAASPADASAVAPTSAAGANGRSAAAAGDGQDSKPQQALAAGWLTAAVAATVALIGCMGWFLTARRLRNASLAEGPAAGARPAAGRIRERRKLLQSACRDDDPGAIHRALLDYLAAFYGQSPAAAAARFRSAGHGALLDGLNARLYGTAGDRDASTISGADILQAVQALSEDDGNSADDPLPPLYS